jgi:hypothetical protein
METRRLRVCESKTRKTNSTAEDQEIDRRTNLFSVFRHCAKGNQGEDHNISRSNSELGPSEVASQNLRVAIGLPYGWSF